MKKLFAILIFLLLIPIAIAQNVSYVNSYKIELASLDKVATVVDTNIEFKIENSTTNQTINDLDAYVVMDPNIRLNLTGRGGGSYYTIYSFQNPGTYKIQSFVINGETFSV